jgi:hypothetical protein
VKVTAYICPDTWKAKGIETRRTSGTELRVTRDEDLKIQTVQAGILPNQSVLEQTSGKFQKVTAYTIPNGASELACFFCRKRRRGIPSRVIDKLISLLNDHRSGIQGTTPVERDERLDEIAEDRLKDYLGGSSKPARNYFQTYGVSIRTSAALMIWIDKPSGQDPDLTDQDCRRFMAQLTGSYPGLASSAGLNLGGAYFMWLDTTSKRGFWISMTIAEGTKSPLDREILDTPPASACSFKCVGHIQYFVEERNRGVIFRIFVPEICQIYRLELIGEINGPRWATYCDWLGPNLCSGQITGSWSDFGILAGKIFETNTVGNDPIPGEKFSVYAYMKGAPVGECNPVLLAQGYYAHSCLTSGEIEKIQLVEDDGSVPDEKTSGSTPDSWVGDPRLCYLTWCEGQPLTIRPSDFYRYSVGERVFVHKGGVRTETQFASVTEYEWGTVVSGEQDVVVAGCQDPHDATELDIYRWDQIRPIQNDQDGTIIPFKCYGVP